MAARQLASQTGSTRKVAKGLAKYSLTDSMGGSP
jgi:hypothetical protein